MKIDGRRRDVSLSLWIKGNEGMQLTFSIEVHYVERGEQLSSCGEFFYHIRSFTGGAYPVNLPFSAGHLLARYKSP
jgi:hypothetical protein